MVIRKIVIAVSGADYEAFIQMLNEKFGRIQKSADI